jgi:hypothetical protein
VLDEGARPVDPSPWDTRLQEIIVRVRRRHGIVREAGALSLAEVAESGGLTVVEPGGGLSVASSELESPEASNAATVDVDATVDATVDASQPA